MATSRWNRRRFLQGAALGAGYFATKGAWGKATVSPPDYAGPNIFLIRFGGGVRREETILAETTYAPFFLRHLAPQGTLYTRMVIDQLEGIETSHGQGTLYLLTGKYDRYEDVGGKFLGQRFEAQVPTLFEYLRKQYAVPTHQTLIINGEDRVDEEFYNFSNAHLYGFETRSTTLSLYRFKLHLLREQLREGGLADEHRAHKERELHELEAQSFRGGAEAIAEPPEIHAFWRKWRAHYGDTGLVNPRGDALLTELTLWAMRELQPRMVMINYQDPDYVHWGNPAHYTRGIAAIDRGIETLWRAVAADPFYRGNTVFAIVPDCGRDANRLVHVPFQHHFNAHEIFALFLGPGFAPGLVINREVQQIDVAPTLAARAGIRAAAVEGTALEEAFA